MKWAFLINGIVQLILAILLYLGVIKLFPSSGVILIKFFALCLGVMGAISILFYKNYMESKMWRHGFLCIMFYNAAMAMICYSSNEVEFPHKLSGSLIHLALFIIFFIGYMSDLKPTKD